MKTYNILIGIDIHITSPSRVSDDSSFSFVPAHQPFHIPLNDLRFPCMLYCALSAALSVSSFARSSFHDWSGGV